MILERRMKRWYFYLAYIALHCKIVKFWHTSATDSYFAAIVNSTLMLQICSQKNMRHACTENYTYMITRRQLLKRLKIQSVYPVATISLQLFYGSNSSYGRLKEKSILKEFLFNQISSDFRFKEAYSWSAIAAYANFEQYMIGLAEF